MNRKVKRYDPINIDGTCGMCVEDADYGAYVEYEDYAALEAENAKLKGEYEWVASINTALDESNQSAWAENAKLRAELERRSVPDGWKLVPVEPTPEMLDAAIQDGICVDGKPVWKKDVVFQAKWKYQQMLAAAPSAPKADDPVKQMLLEALNGMLLHIREPEGESEFQWPEHFKKQKAAFVAARAAIAAARKGEGE